jgi:two-component system cell cycle response regulator
MSSILSITYDVITATDGRDALAVIQHLEDPSSLSMIISDQRMPHMTGVEMFEKTVESLPDVLRIIVSGYSDMSAVISAINKARIFHFISKPFERTEFIMTVKQSLKIYDFKQEMEQEKRDLKEQLTLCKDARALKEMQLEKALKVLNDNRLSIT